jgi:putative membrane protein
MLRLILASLHLLGLGIGLGAVWGRARSLRAKPLDEPALRRAFAADSWWGIAALVWIGTGLARLLSETEKSLSYYMGNHLFWGKMTLLGTIIALEIAPAAALVRWRRRLARGEPPDTPSASRLARISLAQAGLVVLMTALAVAMSRGYGSR